MPKNNIPVAAFISLIKCSLLNRSAEEFCRSGIAGKHDKLREKETKPCCLSSQLKQLTDNRWLYHAAASWRHLKAQGFTHAGTSFRFSVYTIYRFVDTTCDLSLNRYNLIGNTWGRFVLPMLHVWTVNKCNWRLIGVNLEAALTNHNKLLLEDKRPYNRLCQVFLWVTFSNQLHKGELGALFSFPGLACVIGGPVCWDSSNRF